MTPEIRQAMVIFSDVTLVLMIVRLNTFALYAWRARASNGRVLRALAWFAVALAAFFNFFTIVYWDRRWDLWPWADLHRAMGFEWYWAPRLMLWAAIEWLLWALRRR